MSKARRRPGKPSPAAPPPAAREPAPPKPKVFISSTRDPEQLERHLDVVGIVESFGWEAITMTRFTSETQSPEAGDAEKVAECDLFILLLGHRYGSSPPRKTKSFVELEYDEACRLGCPRLAFFVDGKEHPIFTEGPKRNVDDGTWQAKNTRLEKLKQRATHDSDLQVTYYNLRTLPHLVLRALRLWEKKAGVAPLPPAVDKLPTDAGLTAYLAQVVESCSSLRLIGLPKSLEFPITLQDLYVPLHASTEGRGGKSTDDARHAVGRDTTLLATAFRRARSHGAGRGFVLLGHPGAGKTTQLRLMAFTCARADLGPAELDLPADVVPAFLPLRQLEATDLEPTGGPEFLLARALHVDLAFCRWLLHTRKRVLYLFDGLDEVPRALRAKVAAWIQRQHDDDASSYFAVTCRSAGYVDPAQLDAGFLPLDLAPLRPADSDEFVRKWYALVSKHEEGAAGAAAGAQAAENLIAELEKQTVAHIRLNELRANPLFLTILCLVHKNLGKHMPDARAELYDDCIQVLLDRWRVAGLATRWLPRDALRVLQPVALHLHDLGLTRQHRDQLAPVLEAGLKAIRSKETPAAFLDQISEESGLFVGVGGDDFGFLHLGLQEYLAAREIRRVEGEAASRGKPAGQWQKLATRLGETWWGEVVRLLVALDDPPAFRPLFEAVVGTKGWHAHATLIEDCVRLAREPDADPFVRAFEDHRGSDAEREVARRVAMAIAPELALLPVVPKPKVHTAAGSGTEVRVVVSPGMGQRVQTLDCGVKLIEIPAGNFMMGDKEDDDEQPVHRVTFRAPFWLAITAVTNAQYRKFVEATGHTKPPAWTDRTFNGDEQPVVTVSWDDAQAFCKWAGLQLPSEAQWEYACRAGTTTQFSFGDNITPSEVNYDGNYPYRDGKKGEYRKRTVAVGSLPANAWGLHEMHGNVREWCADSWHGNYEGAPADGSAWEVGSVRGRVVRGGSCDANAGWCRSASRDGWPPSGRNSFVGFRPARFITP